MKLKDIIKEYEVTDLQFLVVDIESKRKNIRIILKTADNSHSIIVCDEDISTAFRNKAMTIKELLECYYNPKNKMIELEEAKEDEPIDATVIQSEDIW